MIYVYTVILSGFDNLRPPLVVSKSEKVRYLCFTNIPNLPPVKPWEFAELPDSGNPSRTNRAPKIRPHLYLPSDAEYSVYHDGNFQLQEAPEVLIHSFLQDHDWAAHRHPCRSCIYDEADVILNDESMAGWREQKPERAPTISAEIHRYRAEGYPSYNGLWANGLLIRRHSDAVKALCDDWLGLFNAGGERDQLSFPVARHHAGLPVNTINEIVSASPYMRFNFHAAWYDHPCNRDYAEQRQQIHDSLKGTNLSFPVYE